MYNVFEDILPRGLRDIADIKYTLLDNGALGAVMTGSGPAVFGIFDDENNARKAYEHLKRSYKECHLTKTMERLEI
jgi:4-diphosphocytidyl-2-C-methyl-D-erythritol kinase